ENALLEYPGTILFVTHDRYLVQKIASHLIYIESGTPYVFDRLSAFEEWLANSPANRAKDASTPAMSEAPTKSKTPTSMSKNKRDRLEKEAAGLGRQNAGHKTRLDG